jgi:hypothetical protein
MVLLPTAKAAVAKVATPPDKVPLPMVEPLSRKVTVPVGVPAPGLVALTVVVKVTDWPKTDGLTEEVTAVVVAALLTTWGFPVKEPVEPLKLPSPP